MYRAIPSCLVIYSDCSIVEGQCGMYNTFIPTLSNGTIGTIPKSLGMDVGNPGPPFSSPSQRGWPRGYKRVESLQSPASSSAAVRLPVVRQMAFSECVASLGQHHRSRSGTVVDPSLLVPARSNRKLGGGSRGNYRGAAAGWDPTILFPAPVPVASAASRSDPHWHPLSGLHQTRQTHTCWKVAGQTSHCAQLGPPPVLALPRIDDLQDQLGESKFFTTDLATGKFAYIHLLRKRLRSSHPRIYSSSV